VCTRLNAGSSFIVAADCCRLVDALQIPVVENKIAFDVQKIGDQRS
jgi:hypothetical protein